MQVFSEDACVCLMQVSTPEGETPKLGLDCFRSLKDVGGVAMET